jgi:hypothetical protein
MKKTMDEECKRILDFEDSKRGGIIGETYEKLNELLEVKREAEGAMADQTIYCSELEGMG